MTTPTSDHLHGQLWVVSAPSGAGKTSLVHALLQHTPHLSLSISHTTRHARPGEQNGTHYHFCSAAEFQSLIAADAFIEHAEVFGNYYGTARAQLEQTLTTGRDVILEIDWQGAQQVRRHFPACHSLFILPPSQEALAARLQGRCQDSAEVIAQRLQGARVEMSHYHEYDYVLVNDVFDQTLHQLANIITSVRHTPAAGMQDTEQALQCLGLR